MRHFMGLGPVSVLICTRLGCVGGGYIAVGAGWVWRVINYWTEEWPGILSGWGGGRGYYNVRAPAASLLNHEIVDFWNFKTLPNIFFDDSYCTCLQYNHFCQLQRQ